MSINGDSGGASLPADKKSATVHLPNEVTRKYNYIGKSNWASHKLFKGQMRGFRVWNQALV